MRLQSLSLKLALLLLAFAPQVARAQSAAQATHPAASNVVACRIMEVHANKDPGVVLVIFHQRDKRDQPRFAALLKQSTGGTIQIRPAGAQWQTASVIRLKSCFGRGMLVMPAGTTSPKERADILVKFSNENSQ
jgi:hypothetical protein